jgi:hypothetical protein
MAWSADSQYVFLTGQITNLSGNNIGFVEVSSFFGLLFHSKGLDRDKL